VRVARHDGTRWQLLGAALNVAEASAASAPRVALDRDRTPVVAWSEDSADGRHVYVARWNGAEWRVLGTALDLDRAVGADAPALAVDGAGRPAAAWREGGRIEARRWNGSPSLPPGLPPGSGATAAPCAFPADGDPLFPRTLAQTGCFADVPRRIPAPGVIPYDINAPLWSDGALKRRMFMLPVGATLKIDPAAPALGAFAVPVGTVLVKEFLLAARPGDPASAFIVETRFLVKRCEAGACAATWQGYSYQWRPDFREADLLENGRRAVYVDWPVGDAGAGNAGVHSHGYPGREECGQCHVDLAGGVLGLTPAQLNRSFDYGNAVGTGAVENQLRALSRLGLVDPPLPADQLSATAPQPVATQRLPSPADAAFSLTERVRAYHHANCANCHLPEGRAPAIDFRYGAPLVAASAANRNICDRLIPGNAAESDIYVRAAARPPELPPGFTGLFMPPIASLLPDVRQLALTAAWIDGMTSCP
jgi:mono/diheme cytochrome c family protein